MSFPQKNQSINHRLILAADEYAVRLLLGDIQYIICDLHVHEVDE
jgi:hypothetical protein